MTDDLEQRLARALTRHVEGASAVPAPRPPASSVAATARRRSARRRRVVGGLAAVALLGAAGVTRPWARAEQRSVEVSSAAPEPDDQPAATVAPSTSAVPATAAAPPATIPSAPFGSPSPVTTPEYQPLSWFPLVDGVEVAWQDDGGVTTTWTRVPGGRPRAVGIELAEPQAHVVPTGDRSLLIVVFAGPEATPPTQVAVDADGVEPSWTDVTWDPVASVGWARPRWTSEDAPTEELTVAQR